ncbi:hypothetical protein CDAR_173161 [Caerostris darwini]|uniref:Uncharacterized protein n=1 Tax=Caerostris darwini TaxID=1538125 RepID=A0AAV4WH67_9ARAC|nr:hypothetical protein CDAR_173161 [Caerostris darwini]
MKTITLLSRRVEGVEFSASFASSAQTKPQFMEKYSAIGNAGSMHRRVGSDQEFSRKRDPTANHSIKSSTDVLQVMREK